MNPIKLLLFLFVAFSATPMTGNGPTYAAKASLSNDIGHTSDDTNCTLLNNDADTAPADRSSACDDQPSVDCSGFNPNRNNDPGQCSYTAIGTEFDPTTNVCTLTNDFNSNNTLAGATFPVGTTNVVWTATNTSGATATCSVDITITDNEDPVLTCQNITVELDANGQASFNVFTVGALVSQSDNCSTVGGVGVTGPAIYTCANLGGNSVTIIQDDPSGNEGTCTFTATITDPLNICCIISDLTVSNISACNDQGTSNPNDDTFTADATVTYNTNAPTTGTLDLTGDGTASVAVGSLDGPTSHTFTGVTMSADGGSINLTATFSDDTGCTFQNSNAGTAPASCSPPPVNDLCENASPINCGQTMPGSTIGATFDDVGFCGTINTAPGVWYTFDGFNGSASVTTCSQANYDTKISVFSGACGALACVGGNDDACGLQTTVNFNTTAGTTYLVLVHGFASNIGNFDLTLTCSPVSCDITDISLSNISACDGLGTPDPSDDIFSADVTVTYISPPATGMLDLTGDGTASVAVGSLGSPTSHTFDGVIMSADGGPINLTATFSDDTNCTLTNSDAGTAPGACDPCLYTGAPGQVDSDCDGIEDTCDLCPGGDDNEGYAEGGTPYCADPDVDINDLPAEWRCGNNNNKVLICHNGNTLCVSPNALPEHLGHGDYIGPCNNATCNQNLIAPNTPINTRKQAFQLHPNPTSGIINLSWESEVAGTANMEVVDLNGRVLFSAEMPVVEGRNSFTHHVHGFQNGVYFLRITSASDWQLFRFVKTE